MAGRRVVELDCDIRSLESAADDERVEPVDCYRLPDLDLSDVLALLIPTQIDQEFLAQHQQLIRRYLDTGGIVVFNGHLSRPWLPGGSAFVPLTTRRRRDFRVTHLADHPLFAGLEPDQLTFRRAVAGFFARGHHPVPPGARVLARLYGGQPCTYQDRVSTAGTILVHATGELRGFLGRRVVDWVLAQASAADQELPAANLLWPADRDPSAWPPSIPRLRTDGGGVAAVHGGSSMHLRALTHPDHVPSLGAGVVHLADLPRADLTGVDTLIIPERMHRTSLTAGADNVLGVLERGGCVVTFSGGEPLPEFLPGIDWEHRPTNYWWWLTEGASLGLQAPDPQHALFDFVELRNCSWHYHGVLSPPAGAVPLVALPGGEVLIYLDQVSTPGTLVVSTLDPLSHFGGYFMPATTRFLAGFLPWLAQSAGTQSAST